MTETPETNQQNDRSSATDILKKVAQITSSKLDLREILDTITHVVADVFDKNTCSICLLKPDKKCICIEAAKNTGKECINVFRINDSHITN